MMTMALCLVLYGGVLAWLAPPVLRPMTSEMCADDAAARSVGTRPLLAGLLSMAGHQPRVAEGLAVAGTAVAVRAVRLATPARRRIQWSHRVSLGAAIVVMFATPVFIQMVCHH